MLSRDGRRRINRHKREELGGETVKISGSPTTLYLFYQAAQLTPSADSAVNYHLSEILMGQCKVSSCDQWARLIGATGVDNEEGKT